MTPHSPTFIPCGAKTRHGGSCRQPAMRNGRCRLHGGKSLGGIASPTFKDGRRSKYLPARLMERYQAGLKDPELLNLQDEIALIDARLNDVLLRVDVGESGALWGALKTAHSDFMMAARLSDKDGQVDAMRRIGTALDSGAEDYRAWHEAQALIEQRRKLVEAEQKRRIAMQQMITADQAMVLAAAILATIKAHVTDRPTLAAIQTDINRLISTPDR